MKKIFFAILLFFAAIGNAEKPSSATDDGFDFEALRQSMKEAGIKDAVIDETIDDISNGYVFNIIDPRSIKSLSSDFSIELTVDPYADSNNRYIGKLKAAPSLNQAIVQSIKMLQPAEQISFKDISFDDFVIYTVLENMDIKTSYTELSPGFKQASYKYKLKKKYPNEGTLIDQFSNLKFKLPADYTLDMIEYEGTADNGLKKTQSIQEWKNNIGEKELQKQWNNFVKQYKQE